VGSCSKTQLAYIAGFLDGDGSLMMQIKKRNDNDKARFMLTICMYQDTRHEKPLLWMRKKLEIGYISRRNDNITELRINGYKQTERILKLLKPFVKFKSIQTEMLLKSAKILQKKKISDGDYKKLVDYIIRIQSENYITKKKRSKEELLKVLGLTP
jgi:putative cell wall-binding protein